MLKKFSLLMFAFIFFIVMSEQIYAAPSSKGAMTPPPIYEIGVVTSDGLMKPNDTNSIQDKDNHIVEIIADTYATTAVDKIGATFYLEQWDGDLWVNVASSTTKSITDNDTFSGYVSYSVQGGYYYRAYTLYFVQEGVTYESGDHYSSYIYIQN